MRENSGHCVNVLFSHAPEQWALRACFVSIFRFAFHFCVHSHLIDIRFPTPNPSWFSFRSLFSHETPTSIMMCPTFLSIPHDSVNRLVYETPLERSRMLSYVLCNEQTRDVESSDGQFPAREIISLDNKTSRTETETRPTPG